MDVQPRKSGSAGWVPGTQIETALMICKKRWGGTENSDKKATWKDNKYRVGPEDPQRSNV